ncbi:MULTISPECIES: hypothetical protein [unclassified Streptomyces]|uniref:hypothetical protein n=1 Tax=unclassified Streptomyces TaxID=2593676 RepID=UPI000AA9C57D|nr:MULTISPECIES: hypothetical protein [unclassified Streptomyces]
MRDLIVSLVLIVAVFALLLALGSSMGGVETGIWAVALLAAITVVVRRYARQRRLGQ